MVKLDGQPNQSVAVVLMGLAKTITIYLSRRRGALDVYTLTFTIRASDSSWHPGHPGRLLFHNRLQIGLFMVKFDDQPDECVFSEMGLFAPPSLFCKTVCCVRETEILVERQSPQGVFVCDHAGLVINEFSHRSLHGQS